MYLCVEAFAGTLQWYMRDYLFGCEIGEVRSRAVRPGRPSRETHTQRATIIQFYYFRTGEKRQRPERLAFEK